MNKTKLNKNGVVLSILAMLFAVGFFGITAGTVLAATPCANGVTLAGQEAVNYVQSGKIKVDLVKISATHIQTTVTNDTDCQLPTSVNSYRVYDNVSFDTQKQIDSTSVVVIDAHSSYSFGTKMDNCLTQADAFYNLSGSPVRLLRGMIFGVDGRIFDSIPAAQGQFCTDYHPQTLHGSCSVNPITVNVNGTLNWGATATGGNGQYSYTWSGTDGLVGYSSAVSKSYNTSGTKTGTVTIQSNGQSVSYTCSATVQDEADENLSISCSADDSRVEVDEDVTYRASAHGGTGSYSYDWDGSENLHGNSRSVTWSYDNDGNKSATVTVTSGGQTAAATCRVRVIENESNSVLAYSQSNPNNQVLDAVYLNQVPYTGLADNMGIIWFTLGLALFSAWIAYIVISYKKQVGEIS